MMMAQVENQSALLSPLDRLRYYEQRVNDRFGTAPAPASLGDLLPERGARFPLHWLPCSRDDVWHFATDPAMDRIDQLADGDHIHVPVHPLSVDRLSEAGLVKSGQISFSASYRTAFYEPDPGGPLSDLAADGQILMLKLHLAEPLPGIPGDRRLTMETLERCVRMSQVLAEELAAEPMAGDLTIIPESFGVGAAEAGFLLRIMPDAPLVPVFSLYSRDPDVPGSDPLIITALKSIYGEDAPRAALEAGEWLARPLLSPVLAGFRRGFSLEMHAQNTLVTTGDDRPIEHVWFRDMEGVLLFDELRESAGLPSLTGEMQNAQWAPKAHTAGRLFNRNVDHDLKRIFDGVLRAAESTGYFGKQEVRTATRSLRSVSNALISEAGLDHLGRAGRLMPVSRAPWGNGLRLGHYFRTRYR